MPFKCVSKEGATPLGIWPSGQIWTNLCSYSCSFTTSKSWIILQISILSYPNFISQA